MELITTENRIDIIATELIEMVWCKKQPPLGQPWITLEYCVEIEQIYDLIWKNKSSNSPRLAAFYWLHAQLARLRD